jgi:hypothetical protein
VNDTLASWQSGRRRRETGEDGCLSNLALDRLAQGECSASEQEQARAHLNGCPGCAGAAAALADDRARFADEADVPALVRDAVARAQRSPAQPRWSRWLAPVFGVGLAAAGFLLLARNTDPGSDLRAKGGFSVELYVKHAEGPVQGRLHAGEPLHPGDHVRVRLLNAPASSFVAVLAVDTRAAVSVYYPLQANAAALGDGANEPLPSAVELDGTLGGELLLAFSCPQALPVASLVAAVQQAVSAADPALLKTDPAAALAAQPVQPVMDTPCAIARYKIEKLPRAGGL